MLEKEKLMEIFAEHVSEDNGCNVRADELYGFVQAVLGCIELETVDALASVARFVRDTFKRDIDQGFETKDKIFAVKLLTSALSALEAPLNKELSTSRLSAESGQHVTNSLPEDVDLSVLKALYHCAKIYDFETWYRQVSTLTEAP